MAVFSALVVGFVYVLLQTLLAPRIALGEVSPDFMLLLVAFFAVRHSAERGAVAGFVVGLFQDLFNPQLLGLNALSKSMVGYGIGLIGAKTDPSNALFLAALLFGAAAASDFVYLLFFTGLHLGRFFMLWATVSIPSSVYTAVAGVVLHWASTALGSKAGRAFGKARS